MDRLPRIYVDGEDIETNEMKSHTVDLHFGAWQEVPLILENARRLGAPAIYDIPIIPGRNIQAELMFEGTIDGDSDNPLFSSGSFIGREGNTYTFRTMYATGPVSFPSLNEAVLLAQQQPEMADRKKELGDTIEQIKAGDDLEKTLLNIYDFVRSAGSEEEYDLLEMIEHKMRLHSFGKILEYYRKNSFMPPDCVIASTFTAGFINALGLEARRVMGYLELENAQTIKINGEARTIAGMGHAWPEAFIPQNKIWVPIDPAGGCALAFPEKGDGYCLTMVELPRLTGDGASIRLSYV